MVEVFYSVTIGVGVGGVGNRGRSVEGGGGDASVADGGGARWRDCCRFSNGIFKELQEDPHIASHSCSMSLIYFRKLACKEEVV